MHDQLAALLCGCSRHHPQPFHAARPSRLGASPSRLHLLQSPRRLHSTPFPADARSLFDEMLRRNLVSWSRLNFPWRPRGSPTCFAARIAEAGTTRTHSRRGLCLVGALVPGTMWQVHMCTLVPAKACTLSVGGCSL
jgi:hypothetical protein